MKFRIGTIESVAESTHIQAQLGIEFISFHQTSGKTNPEIAIEIQICVETRIGVFAKALVIAEIGEVKAVVGAVEAGVGHDEAILSTFFQWGNAKGQRQWGRNIGENQIGSTEKDFVVGYYFDFTCVEVEVGVGV